MSTVRAAAPKKKFGWPMGCRLLDRLTDGFVTLIPPSTWAYKACRYLYRPCGITLVALRTQPLRYLSRSFGGATPPYQLTNLTALSCISRQREPNFVHAFMGTVHLRIVGLSSYHRPGRFCLKSSRKKRPERLKAKHRRKDGMLFTISVSCARA